MLSALELNKEESVHGHWCNARENEVTERITEKVDYRVKRREFFLGFVKWELEDWDDSSDLVRE